MRRLSIFGSTGSIGTQALEVVDELKGSKRELEVNALVCNTKIDLLEEQVRKYRPKYACVIDQHKAGELREKVKDIKETTVVGGLKDTIEACSENTDIVLNSAVGIIGLEPTIAFLEKGIDVALANKETIVTAGKIAMDTAKKHNASIIPVDSEHSAIFQCLQGNDGKKVEKLILTCSGGPFRGKKRDQLNDVTVEQALKHPKWDMGPKITIDSATLMNKALEIIEARWLFDVKPENIQVKIHKESTVHSAVQYVDGSIIAQLGRADMRIPIQYALTYPERMKNNFDRLDLNGTLEFSDPDTETFKALNLAYK